MSRSHIALCQAIPVLVPEEVAVVETYPRNREKDASEAVNNDSRHGVIRIVCCFFKHKSADEVHPSSQTCMQVHLESSCIFLVTLSHAFALLGQRPCHLPKLREEDEGRTNNEKQVAQVGFIDHRKEGDRANQIKGRAGHRGKEVDAEPQVRTVPLGVMQPLREIREQKSQRSDGIEPR